MHKHILPTLIICTLALNGCTSHSKVIVDPQGIDMNIYQKDLAECQQLADQVESNVVQGAIGGAIVGSIVGALIGADNKGARHRGYRSRHHRAYRSRHNKGYRLSTEGSAALGAVSGALLASSGSMQSSKRVLINCIADRGYRILN